ncbi:hypothetical protein GLA29479_917 [Lysobacter antibioticus]|uniref:Uncharacterized protein n=1 Tax=Lysobacter antibioticus TaxID=84531 RepID=A0A0S2FEA6_LYSAN|nr:hypothetical protein GLA29479_917 [Lysobacter antibioticus]ALN81879.1 hypothetical protein LA76x_3757 [Lysobacter antibioticus]
MRPRTDPGRAKDGAGRINPSRASPAGYNDSASAFARWVGAAAKRTWSRAEISGSKRTWRRRRT